MAVSRSTRPKQSKESAQELDRKDQRSESPTIEIAMGLGICAKSSPAPAGKDAPQGKNNNQHKTF